MSGLQLAVVAQRLQILLSLLMLLVWAWCVAQMQEGTRCTLDLGPKAVEE